MRTTIYDPFNTLRRLQDDMNRAFGSALSTTDDNSNSAVSHWTPAVDIHEETERYVITADVPGVSPEDIEVTMENGVLTISGHRADKREETTEGGARRVERVSGSFYRRFTLPDSVEADGIEAASNHGVLEIVIPKKSQVQPRKIRVKP